MARLDGAETDASMGMRAATAFCTISNDVSIVLRPQTPHELFAVTRRRSASTAATRSAASPQGDVDDVVLIDAIGVGAVANGTEIVRVANETFCQEEPRRQLAVGARRSHDDDE